jgi:hypothetical protein
METVSPVADRTCLSAVVRGDFLMLHRCSKFVAAPARHGTLNRDVAGVTRRRRRWPARVLPHA